MPKDMGQTPIEGDDSHDEFFYDTASTSERDILLRAFPDPLPLGHRIVHRWDYSKGPGKLMVRVEKVRRPRCQQMTSPTRRDSRPRRPWTWASSASRTWRPPGRSWV
jgi:hypothetical protein